MKFDLTIKDATFEEVSGVLARLNVVGHVQTTAPIASVTTPEIAKTDTLSPTPLEEAVNAAQTTFDQQVVGQSVIAAQSGILAANIDHFLQDDDEEDAPESGEGVDAEGLPWDKRIHSSNRKKTQDGVWRRKRGLQDFQYNEVKSELLGQKVQTPAPAGFSVGHSPVLTATLPPVPPVPTATLPPIAPVRDFNNIMDRIKRGFQTGKCNPTYIPTLAERLKQINPSVVSVPDIAGNDQLIAAAHNIMDMDGIE